MRRNAFHAEHCESVTGMLKVSHMTSVIDSASFTPEYRLYVVLLSGGEEPVLMFHEIQSAFGTKL